MMTNQNCHVLHGRESLVTLDVFQQRLQTNGVVRRLRFTKPVAVHLRQRHKTNKRKIKLKIKLNKHEEAVMQGMKRFDSHATVPHATATW